ncbi:hypothetical protein [Caulobacter sp. RHG1]|nr:hypothetical protein [Caulobacter sp. RHG1]NQE64466.1 hypothetical protein [Caulobacter sp. RHG1]
MVMHHLEDEADLLLGRIMMIRDDLKAGRLTWEQVQPVVTWGEWSSG